MLTGHVGDFGAAESTPAVLLSMHPREGVRVVQRKDGARATVAYLVAPTRVSSFAFHLAVVWELDPTTPAPSAPSSPPQVVDRGERARRGSVGKNLGVVNGSRQPAERLQRLQALTDAALVHLELEQLLAAILERTRELVETDTCAILLLDAERAELVARAAVGIEEEVEQGVRIPLGQGFAGRVAADQAP